jgi:hypothetical protein
LSCSPAAGHGEVPIAIGNTVGDVAADAELVEVTILPAHDDLKDPVQAVEADGQRHLHAPANRRLDRVEGDGEPGNLVGAGHGTRLAEYVDEFQGNSR